MKSGEGITMFRLGNPLLKRVLLVLMAVLFVTILLVYRSRLSTISLPSTVIKADNTTTSPGTSSSWSGRALNKLTSYVAKAVGSPPKGINSMGGNDTGLHMALRRYASKDNVIILSSCDSGYIEMAMNLHETSFQKFGLEHYLFVGSDSNICRVLQPRGITCFEYIHDKDGASSSAYFSQAFKRKTHLKTKIILEALLQGLTVLIVDVDIVFLKDPFKDFKCADCDIQIQYDVSEGNSGFYLARPTPASIKLHEMAWDKGLKQPGVSNQKALDRTMEGMMKSKTIKVKILENEIFPNGKVYFEDGRRMFLGDNPCKTCAIVHNNWIVSGEAKAYRFKDHGMWDVDVSGYYSNGQTKYLAYGNPKDFGAKQTLGEETAAIKAALVIGHILNRTVILPKFHCHGCKYGACQNAGKWCTFATFYRVTKFDKQFKDSYREHVFLSHHKVPESVKNSLSAGLLIETDSSRKLDAVSPDGVQRLEAKDATKGPSVDELKAWLTTADLAEKSVLRFHSLYGLLGQNLVKDPQLKQIMAKLAQAFDKTDYRQY